MERGKIGNDGTMNDQYHWQKAKPEKFNHSLTQVILNEAYPIILFEAVERDLGFFSPSLLCAINKKTARKEQFR